jgi:hypothetical protein
VQETASVALYNGVRLIFAWLLLLTAGHGGHLDTEIVDSNPARRGMDVCLYVSVLCCPVYVEAFAKSRLLIQRSPTKCLNKVTKSPV